MAGPLLKSATLKTYHPVGAVGNPVYLAASQLRAAIARRLGADVADIFAIPQRNEDGDTVDWYAPNPGTVVPWSAATEAERSAARERLLDVRGQIEDLGRDMEAEVSAERQVFGRLLAHVMQFPDEQDVHLVNGQPVLTFWGFVKDRAAVGSDPLRDLAMHVARPEPAQEQAQRGGRPWWLWLLLGLLLLLLLALLLWGLRGCDRLPIPTGARTPVTEQAPQEERRLTAPEAATEDPVAEAEPPMPEPMPDPVREFDPVAVESQTVVDRIDGGVRTSDRVERTVVDGGVSSVRDVRDVTGVDAAADALAADRIVDSAAGADALEDPAIGADGDVDAAVAVDGPDGVPADAEADLAVDDAIAEGADAIEAEALEEADAPADVDPVVDADAPLADAGTEVPLAEGDGAEAVDAEVPPTAGEGADGEAAAETPAAEDAAAPGDPAADAQADAAAGAEASADAPESGDPAPNTAAGAETAATPDSALDADAAAAAARAAAAAGGAGTAGAGTGTGAGAVSIPPRELLNSGWRTSRTLQDPKDGSPVHLDYRLKDGAGSVRLTRKDGSICRSDAVAGVRDGRLVVDSKQDIVCADGTNFGRPQIDCTPKAGGKASCVGRYADGSVLPIEMQRQAE